MCEDFLSLFPHIMGSLKKASVNSDDNASIGRPCHPGLLIGLKIQLIRHCGFDHWYGLNIAPGPLTDESRQLVPGEKEHLHRHSSSGHLADMHRVEENKLVFEFHLREILLRDFQIQHNANHWLNGQKNESQTVLLMLAGNILLSQQIKSVSTEWLRPLEKMLLFLFLNYFLFFFKHSNHIIWLISKTILIKSCKMYIVFFVLHFNLMVHFRHSVDCK